MLEDLLKCPKCGENIEISQVIALDIKKRSDIEIHKQIDKEKQLILKDYENREKILKDQFAEERKKIEEKVRKSAEETINVELSDLKTQLTERDNKLKDFQNQELELRKKERLIQEKEEHLLKDYENREKILKDQFAEERKKIEEKIRKSAEETINVELSDLKTQLTEKSEQLKNAQNSELEFRRKQRELDEKEKAMDLEINRKVDEERKQIIEKTHRALEEQNKLKNAEKDKQLEDMKTQIEELKRKAEQGTIQIQGEVLETEIETSLKLEFPFDDIEPVAKGIKGGDVIQTVKTQSGKICGKILWEAKRTRNWNDTWIQKLKDDQRDARADLAILVSESLPKGFHHFRKIDNIWVTDIPSYISLALALRTLLIQVEKTKALETGREGKKEAIYNYLTGSEFGNRIQAIIETFVGMKGQLDTERRAMEKQWASREKQLQRVILNIAGMKGDIEGIAGTSLPVINQLELPSEETISDNVDI